MLLSSIFLLLRDQTRRLTRNCSFVASINSPSELLLDHSRLRKSDLFSFIKGVLPSKVRVRDCIPSSFGERTFFTRRCEYGFQGGASEREELTRVANAFLILGEGLLDTPRR